MDQHFVAFAGVATGMIMLPGADFAVVVRNSLEGRLRGAVTGVGVALGLVLHTAIAATGLAVVVASSPRALAAIQYVGVAYLLYLGGWALRTAWRGRHVSQRNPAAERSRGHPNQHQPSSTLTRVAFQGFLTNALNPKAPLLFLSLMPQFVPPGRSTTFSLVIMSMIVVVIGLAWFPGVALVASRFSRFVETQSRRVLVDGVTGAVLVVFAVVVAIQ